MKKLTAQILLTISGSLLLVIGTLILIFPHTFYASNGIELGHQASLLTEIRAPGGLLIGCGAIIILGVFRQGLTRPALVLSVLVYGTYGVAHFLSMAIDGIPAGSLVAAAIVELVIASLCLLLIPWSIPGVSRAEDEAGKGLTFERRNYGID